MDVTALRKSIPDSVLPYPEGVYNRSKYMFWKVIYPFHNVGRDVLLAAHIIHHEGRQDYVLGHIAPGKTLEGFVEYLKNQGMTNHFIAWRDDDEILSVRKLVDFEHQYHLRVFADGEVRGHFEYTPEGHPRWHMKEIGLQAKREEFLRFLGDWVTPAPALATASVEN